MIYLTFVLFSDVDCNLILLNFLHVCEVFVFGTC